MTKVEYGNGDVTTYTYNSLNLRLTRLYTVDKNGAALQDLNYTYDSVGNILSIDDKVNTADQTFQYDELNRLTQATNPNPGTYGLPAGQAGTKTYVYDAIGNIVQKDGKTYFYGAAGAASGGPHAVTALSDGTTFSYDANGNMVTKVEADVTTNYTYDSENRLIQVKKGGSIIGQYSYDGDGGRTTKTATISGTTTTTTYVGSLFETSGSRTTKFIFLGDQRVAAVTNSPTLGSEVLYYHADHLGGANVLTDATGFKKELIEYEPFGQESRHEKYGSSEEVAWYYFTGKPKDDETGLYDFGSRMYNPALGRFIQPDSVVQSPGGSPQTFNRYSYCGNNPVNLVDPSGHWFFAAIFAAVKAIAAAAIAHPVIAGAVVGAASSGIQSYQATGSVNPLSIGIGAVTGGLAGGTLGMTGAQLAKLGAGGFLLKASAGASLLSQVLGAAGLDDVSQGFQYASMGLSAAYLGLNIGIGIRDWAYESRFKITNLSGERAAITSNSHVHVNGITTGFDDALVEAGQRGANYLAYNPTSGLIPDLAEGLLDKLTFTSSVSRQLGHALNGLSGITLSGFSQGGMIASNTALALGLRDQRQVIGQLRVYSTQISQARVAVSGAIGGGLTWQKTVTYGIGSPFDFSNALGPNMGPAFFGGVVGVSILPIGVGNHRMPQ